MTLDQTHHPTKLLLKLPLGEVIINGYFKLPSFEVICYAAIDNQHMPQRLD